MSALRLGTRQSALALAQSGQIAARIEARHPGVRVELVPVVTRGDREPGDLSKIGGKGLFTEELERGLLDGGLDLAVHSLKDLPVRLPDGLVIAAYPERADPRDVLVTDQAGGSARVLDDLPRASSILTGSLRRIGQLRSYRDDFQVLPIRGNVDTRLRRWREGGHGGVVLAAAGLARLGILDDLPAFALDTEDMVPAPGQGTLAIEVRAGGTAAPLVAALDHPATARSAAAERLVVAALGGDCTLPLGALARVQDDGTLLLRAALIAPDGSRRADGGGRGATPEEAAEACLDALRADGAEAVLASCR